MKSRSLVNKIGLTVLASWLVLGSCVQAQSAKTYPERPVKLIVGFQAGAATDTLARVIGQNLTPRLNQSFPVENKPGAATRIAMDALNKSLPDGYTLAVANAVTTLFPMMFNGMSFEPGKDFTPISLLGRSPSFIAIKSSLPAQNFKEFAQLAKGAKLSFGHPGNGTNPHIAGMALAKSLEMNVVDVAFKGNQPVTTAMAAGEIDFAMLEYESARPLVERGLIRLLAVTEAKRYPVRPDIPTGREVGVTPEIEGLTPWFILLAPPDTPTKVVGLLNAEIAQMMQQPDTQERLLKIGIEQETSTPSEAAEYFLAHRQKVTKLLEQLNISIQN
jgi:tripartite-type tricarboxylate transporter receptor subunit TctC